LKKKLSQEQLGVLKKRGGERGALGLVLRKKKGFNPDFMSPRE